MFQNLIDEEHFEHNITSSSDNYTTDYIPRTALKRV